ncbi:hypothetical protein H0H92_007243 [Tricholoma furcatifolium]|nr:hypothetical protein H0H92_007243 [Tricholoma furcatifolium]
MSMKEERDIVSEVLPLDIIIVGGGIGGLAAGYCLGRAGHRVTVLEKASTLLEGRTGAGIQATPNLTRLLMRWGIDDQLRKVAVIPQGLCLRRYSDGDPIGWNKWGDEVEREHGAPYYHIHRADLHKLLLELAAPHITLRLDCTVIGVEPETPSVLPEGGEVLKADLVIGADGVRSIVRDAVLGRKDPPRATGDSAYRAVISTRAMLEDPDLRPLVEEAEAHVWMGPARHIVAYCIRSKEEYNLVMVHPSKEGDSLGVPIPTDCEEVKAEYAAFEPRIQKLLNLMQSTMSWALVDHDPLKTWVHSSNKVCLLGDACHPMLPYRAQGAAMAVEDAAVLGNLLSHIPKRSDLPRLLRAYEQLRHPRTSEMQYAARANQFMYHIPDGPQQVKRDLAMRKEMEDELLRVNRKGGEMENGKVNPWANKSKLKALYDYDADKEVTKWRMRKEGSFVAPLARL